MQSETDCNDNQDNLNKIEQQIIFTIETQAQLSSSPNTLARSLSHKTQNTNSNKLILLLSLQLKDYKLGLDKAKVNTNEFQVNRNQRTTKSKLTKSTKNEHEDRKAKKQMKACKNCLKCLIDAVWNSEKVNSWNCNKHQNEIQTQTFKSQRIHSDSGQKQSSINNKGKTDVSRHSPPLRCLIVPSKHQTNK